MKYFRIAKPDLKVSLDRPSRYFHRIQFKIFEEWKNIFYGDAAQCKKELIKYLRQKK